MVIEINNWDTLYVWYTWWYIDLNLIILVEEMFINQVSSSYGAPEVTGKRTFSDSELTTIKNVFREGLLNEEFLKSSEIIVLAEEQMPEIFERYGKVKICNKYRELEAWFKNKGTV